MLDIPIGTIQSDPVLIERLFDFLNQLVAYEKVCGLGAWCPQDVPYPGV